MRKKYCSFAFFLYLWSAKLENNENIDIYSIFFLAYYSSIA